MSDGEGLNYASSGVDIDLEAASVASSIGALSKSVRKAGSPGAPVDLPGGFGGLVEFGDNLLALATDGVGSKLQIANELNQLAGVGIDETSASMGGTVSMMKDGIPRGSLLFPARSVTCRVQPV